MTQRLSLLYYTKTCKLLYIATDNKCKKFFCVNRKLCWERDELYGYHLEVDTHIAFHVKHIDINDPGPGEIVVWANY